MTSTGKHQGNPVLIVSQELGQQLKDINYAPFSGTALCTSPFWSINVKTGNASTLPLWQKQDVNHRKNKGILWVFKNKERAEKNYDLRAKEQRGGGRVRPFFCQLKNLNEAGSRLSLAGDIRGVLELGTYNQGFVENFLFWKQEGSCMEVLAIPFQAVTFTPAWEQRGLLQVRTTGSYIFQGLLPPPGKRYFPLPRD